MADDSHDDHRHEHHHHDGHGHGGHDHGGHDHDGHGHGHANDQGLRGALRYLRFAPQMWRSEINDAVVDLADPQAGEFVLDIGAGMGAGVARAAASGASITAIEPTPFLRQVLSLRTATFLRKSSITVIDGAAEKLVVRDGSIDAVWAVNTMHHWVDQERAAAEISRVLAPNGRAVLVDENFSDPSHPDHEEFTNRHGEDHDHGFHMVDVDEMAALMSGVGLTQIDASERDLAGRPVFAVISRKPS